MEAPISIAPSFDPTPRDSRLAGWLQEFPPELFSERLYRSVELMERYSIELAIDVINRLNVFPKLEQLRSSEQICEASGFQPHFAPALGWLLNRLIETGCIECQGDGSDRCYRLAWMPWTPDPAALRSLGLKIDPGNRPTLDLLDEAARLYPAVALGEQKGEAGLFRPEAIPLWLNYFHNGNLTYAVNNWPGAVASVSRLAKHSQLRILEIGAGAGSATEILLQWLDQRGLRSRIARYLITEPNAFFRRRGQRELSRQYRDLPLEWETLDIDTAWDGQGIGRGEFDLVYGVNVMHVAKDILFTLDQARQTLAPRGWCVCGECIRPYPDQPVYAELMFQILDSFTDVAIDPSIRPQPGFLTADQWRQAFVRSGFADFGVLPDLEQIREIYPHFFVGAVCGYRAAGC